MMTLVLFVLLVFKAFLPRKMKLSSDCSFFESFKNMTFFFLKQIRTLVILSRNCNDDVSQRVYISSLFL